MAAPKSITVFAVPGVLVPVPRLYGIVARYVGRGLVDAEIKAGGNLEACYPIDRKANATFLSNPAIYTELFRAIRHRDILPGDQATADWAGVKFEPVANPTAINSDGGGSWNPTAPISVSTSIDADIEIPTIEDDQ